MYSFEYSKKKMTNLQKKKKRENDHIHVETHLFVNCDCVIVIRFYNLFFAVIGLKSRGIFVDILSITLTSIQSLPIQTK